MTKRASSVASNYDPELFTQFLNDFGRQYANSYRAACNAEHRYQTGKLPAHYPVPAICYEAHICDTNYPGLMWIDDNSVEDDPIMVWAFNMMTGKLITLQDGIMIDAGWK